MKRRNEKRYFTLCLLLLLVLPQILLSTCAKSFSQEEAEKEQNSQRNEDEWRKSCENAGEVCDECKNMEPECLQVENCRRQGEEQEDHPSSEACAGVLVNDIAVNNFCAYCGQNADKCQNLPICEESGGGSKGMPSMPDFFPCAKEGAQCSGIQQCCRKLTCQSDTAEGGQKQSTCQRKSGQQQKPENPGNGKPEKPSGNGKPEKPTGGWKPGRPSGQGKPQKPSGNGKPEKPSGGQNPGTGCTNQGAACQRIGDTSSCCPGLNCEKSSNFGKPGPGYECVALVNEPITPSSAPASQNQCKLEGAACSFTGDPSCCPALSCESSSDLGTPGPAYQCVGLKSEDATKASCKREKNACAYTGDPSCCPQLSCERSSDIGIPGPEFQCVGLLYGGLTTTSSSAGSETTVPSAPIDATFSYKSK